LPTIPYKKKDGTRVKGTTTIIGQNIGWGKDGLMYWSWNLGMQGIDYKAVRDVAADSGTYAHYLADCHLCKIDPDKEYLKTFEEEVARLGNVAYKNFLKWMRAVKFKILKSEIHLVSEKYGYGATPDMLAYINNELSLFDWKTSKKIHENYLIQMIAYKEAWEENFPDDPLVGGVHLVRFPKDSESFHHSNWSWSDLYRAGAWDCFEAAIMLSKSQKKLEGLL
jgi:hypothetical protein